MKEDPELCEVISKHLPSSSTEISHPEFATRAEVYALVIRIYVLEAVYIHGYTESTSQFRDVVMALRKLNSAINGLSFSDRRTLLAMSFVNQVENSSALDDFQASIDVLSAGANKASKYHTSPAASQKRNWMACAAAGICRQVWADEEIATNGKSWRKFRSSRSKGAADIGDLKSQFRVEYAPTSQKADAPGPFGRFLEDVMEVLEIKSLDGQSIVSSSVALRSLNSLK